MSDSSTPRTHSLTALLAAAALALGIGIAPTVAAPEAKAADPVTLTVASTSEIDSMNPFLAYYLASTTILRYMYDFLTAYDPKTAEAVPGLAESWSHSKDNLTWTYKIRDNATWSDGEPITAKDAEFTFNLIMTDEDAATANGSYVENFESVTATDAHTLVIKTKKPSASMLAIDVPIVPLHKWKDVKDIGAFKNTPGEEIVGSGPFILTEYKANQFVKLKANKNYWRGGPKYDELIYAMYKDPDSAVQAVRGGQADIVSGLTSPQVNALKGTPDIGLNIGQGRRFFELSFNSGATDSAGNPIGDGHPALKDKRVRTALAYAMDNNKLIAQVAGGNAIEGGGYIPPAFPTYHWDPPADMKREFDLDEANQILDDAGYERGDDGIRTMPGGGEKLSLRFLGHADTQENKMGDLLVSWYKEIGVELKPSIVSMNKLNDDLAAGNFDLIAGGWSVNPDPDFILSIQTCDAFPDPGQDNGSTDQFFCNEEFDQLYKEQQTTLEVDQRAAIVKKMQEIMYEEVPCVIVYYPKATEAYRSDRWESFQLMPDPGGQILNQDGFWGIYTATPTKALEEGDSGSNTGLVVGVTVGAVAVAAAGVGVFALRRKRTAEERE